MRVCVAASILLLERACAVYLRGGLEFAAIAGFFGFFFLDFHSSTVFSVKPLVYFYISNAVMQKK